MKKSIITDNMDFCFVCGRPRECIHHVYYGVANRRIADKHGFVIPLCNSCHTGRNGVHFNKVLDQKIKQHCQAKFEALGHTREAFRLLFGKSYL